jgi:hypothetical protein
VCGNCDAPLTGAYCAQCGQHAHASARPLHSLVHEAWHLLTHVDARLLNTLGVLLAKPGRLTLEYFANHRARHVPPFQLYFVITLVLFAIVSLGMHLHPHDASASTEPAESGPVHLSADFGPCETWDLGAPWLTDVMRDACQRQAADKGKSLMRNFVTSVPRMMFIFLPLMALIMMLFYLRQHRFYVEHLIFFLHLHAALFVAIIVSLLVQITGRYVAWVARIVDPVSDVLWIYTFWYLYLSMRRFYGQGWARTALKLVGVVAVYFAFLCVTSIGTLIINAVVT